MSIKKQTGFSLIAVLVALSILAIILLGIGELQLQSLHYNQQAYQQSIASEQLYKMTQLFQTNAINKSELFRQWNLENRRLLKKGEGKLSQNTINIIWYSDLNNHWKCSIKRQEKRSCLALEIK